MQTVADRDYKEDRENAGFRGRRGKCRFMKEGKCQVDYKDTRMLSKLVTPQGKLFSRKRSGACAYCQRQIKVAVKRARILALLPFVGR
jgi:small subunit ribosomal protein S18